MTSKKRRQRGSRTHGGGSHKNRRGAGHRGGRGNAGRDKHERHNHGKLGKEGFTSHDSDQFDEFPVQKLDEDLVLLSEDGVAEQTDSGYRIDVRDVVDESSDAEGIRVLGNGQVTRELEVIADDFTDPAVQQIEDAGGRALTPDQSQIKESIGEGETVKNIQEYLDEKRSVVEQGEHLPYDEVDQLLELGQKEGELAAVRDIILEQYSSPDEISAGDAVSLYHLRELADEYGIEAQMADKLLEEYFSDINPSEAYLEEASKGLPERISYSDIRDILEDRENRIRRTDNNVFGGDKETQDQIVSANQKRYLFLVRNRLDATG